MPLEFNLFRNREKDYYRQLDILKEKGWIIVTEPIQKIKTSVITNVKINPEDGTLLKKPENFKLMQRVMRRSLASPIISIYSSPYIFLPKKPFWDILNRHEAGSLVAIWDYE
ncbi:MAG: hypothetical protein HN981_00100 [Candidatus Pacebacteria bacterium]|jgi:hypothetical protein|nr:hypothetical protein [Candidatus Paceibacterota bacterium]MBT4652132.1 hypothetical protein [Candidatus Paceibacterota bacterium]MBT6756670.1 hypothetical protein [Candidatus Paceibacterota bacterium]MBT6920785.1 hypothetical protein [Candidatus Paceibacterota bacterium]